MMIATVVAGSLVGCGAASNTLEGRTEPPRPSQPTASERVVIGSPGLARDLKFGDVVTREEGLLLHVQVSLENDTKSAVNFEYRWEWTDADGFQLGDTLSAWQPGFVNGGERKLLGSVGPGPAARNFRLYVRRPGD
ncbi:MAG: YcfL family protein [Deltaproteobacteria bacterium]|nr:YcfL family protein [Deltaproteobacteria bacterium]